MNILHHAIAMQLVHSNIWWCGCYQQCSHFKHSAEHCEFSQVQATPRLHSPWLQQFTPAFCHTPSGALDAAFVGTSRCDACLVNALAMALQLLKDGSWLLDRDSCNERYWGASPGGGARLSAHTSAVAATSLAKTQLLLAVTTAAACAAAEACNGMALLGISNTAGPAAADIGRKKHSCCGIQP